MWFFGWDLTGITDNMPPKFVFIAAPHTSSWDFTYMIAAAFILRLRIEWLGKHTLFTGNLGWLYRALGGIPVDRSSPHNIVEQIRLRFQEQPRLILAVSPEGTRRKSEYWKSGFYHIARGADVPIGLSFLDYSTRTCGIGDFILPSKNVRVDMDKIRDFYKDYRGKFPQNESCIRLREEDSASEEK